jgi:hypothetical protein
MERTTVNPTNPEATGNPFRAFQQLRMAEIDSFQNLQIFL